MNRYQVTQPHFLVDKDGLAKIASRRPPRFVLYELLQNAFDEESVTQVQVQLSYKDRALHIRVEDDAPEGFRDLSHAYTLYAESYKGEDPGKRGRFNLGEKFVLALCRTASIETTRGTVRFTRRGRTNHPRARRESGSVFTGVIPMTRGECDVVYSAAAAVIPPPSLAVTINDRDLPHRIAIDGFEAYLITEYADPEGYLRRGRRRTHVTIYDPKPDETAWLYELGIPVVETGDRWHLDIGQRVPLNMERDNATPAYLQELRTLVASRMHRSLTAEDARQGWVAAALADGRIEAEAVRAIIDKRFGSKHVTYDPSDQEANRIAVAQGYTVIPPGTLNRDQWESVRRAGASSPAGKVTPSPKPFSPDGKPLREVPPEDYTPNMTATVDLLSSLGRRLLGKPISIQVVREFSWPHAAAFGPDRVLVLNLGRLGYEWFGVPGDREQLRLLLHELGHHDGSNHLEERWGENIARLGAALAHLCLEPEVAIFLPHRAGEVMA